MANELPEQSQFDETIEAILTTEPVKGDPPGFVGTPTGKINVILLKLASRSRWLKNTLEALNITVPNATTIARGIAELATKAEAEALQDTTRITPPKRVGDILKHQNAQATESQRGTAELADQAEAEGGTDNTKIMTSEKSMQQLRHSNAGANTTRRGTVQRATQNELDQGKNEDKYITPKLASRIRGFIRTQNPPAASSAKDNIGYIKTNADDKALGIKVKSSRKAPFFTVRIADLGDGHRGYAGSGYGSLANRFGVNTGGSSGYSGLGVISELHNDLPSATFERVGSYTIPAQTNPSSLAGNDSTLYYSIDTGSGTYVRGFNPETGAQTFQSAFASGADSIEVALVIANGLAYVFDWQDNDFYTFNLSSGAVTQLSNTNYSGRINALAEADGTIYALAGASLDTVGLATVHPTTGAVATPVSITGIPSGYRAISMTGINNELFVVCRQTASPNTTKLYRLNKTTAILTEIGTISPANSRFEGLAQVGNVLYALSANRQVYRSTAGQGNRWEVVFPTSTTEVADDDDTLKLFASPGASEIILNRQAGITDAVVFASDFDFATAHTISVGNNLSMALYNSDNEQLYEGANEAVYATIPLQAPTEIGV